MNDKLKTIGVKPAGVRGLISGRIMNMLHRRFYKKIIRTHLLGKFDLTFGNTVLDIGCGGGKAVSLFFDMFSNSMICGIDHSKEMVELASNVNRTGIKRGIVEIKQAGVTRIPYPDNYFNLITAFDTINFWEDYRQAMSEINRVLNQNGILFIVNAFPKEGKAWYDHVKLKSRNQYIQLLRDSGFQAVHTDLINKNIVVYGRKA